jgi:hypothetical protein
MRQQTRLLNAINDRYDRLANTDAQTIDHQVLLTRDWINAQPELRAILAEAEQVERNMSFRGWRLNLAASKKFAWLSRTEAGRAWLAWRLMDHLAANFEAGENYPVEHYAARFRDLLPKHGPASSVRRTNDYVVQEFVKQIFLPLFQYLGDQVGLGTAVVHVLQRYVARIEWFDRSDLYRRYQEAVTAGRVGEEVYNLDLQRFLFLDGGYITQAKARSASGEADLVGGLDTDDPLVCEGKLFDGSGRGKSYLAKGFHQVIMYAHDYNKAVAHLVVFNLTDKLLQFDADGPAGAWAPYVQHERVRVHLIVVRAHPPDTTASKAGKATVVRIRREDLITVEADTNETQDHDAPATSGI